MTPVQRLAAVALLSLLPAALGCGAIEDSEELQALAGDGSPQAQAGSPPAPAAGSTSAGGGESLESFPLVGSVFPGLGGRLHSSLCDPASDPYSTCI